MLKALSPALLISSLLISICVADNGYNPRCNCDDEDSLWNIGSILEWQRVSDFLIAVAYISIPVQLLYFVRCSNNVPFKVVLFQFIAIIVMLHGLTHLLNGWTYGPHPFQLMLALTLFKIVTALVTPVTAITLITLIPMLLKAKVREVTLREKTRDLGREVGMIMKRKETGLHVRMLTQEIRKSLDRHTILYTTLVELSKTLGLQNCAVWMPNEIRTEMNLTHELKGRNYSNVYSIPIGDPDVIRIKGSHGVIILRPDSALATASSGESGEPGPVAARRMSMLRVRNFNGGTPEMVQDCYTILVLVLPSERPRSWSTQELEIVKVVVDEVAVALSHAAVLEESQLMRDKLVEQNRALQLAKQNAMMASQARNSFQKVMSDGMRKPMHSISGLLSLMQDENLSGEQKLIVETMESTSNVLSTLINDAMDISTKDSGRFPLEIRSFRMHSMIKEAACLARCLCVCRGFNFSVDVERSLPDHVIGDERRVFQVILHVVGNLLNDNNGGGTVMLRIFSESASQERNDQRWATWRQSSSDGDIYIRFEIGIKDSGSQSEGSISMVQHGGRRYTSDGIEQYLSFSICKKIVQLMQGNIWVVPNPQGFAQSMSLVLRFQLRQSIAINISESGESSEYPQSNSLFRGLQVLLADHGDMNRAVTRKLLEKLGCIVTSVSSGFECLCAIVPSTSSFQIVLLELQMPELDGFEVAMRIRKFRSRSLFIIALTASADGDAWERCKQNGMNGVIRKPVQLQGIANELRRILLQANKIVS